MKRLLRICMIVTALASGFTMLCAREPKSEFSHLPSKISKKCHTPAEWVLVGSSRKVTLQTPPDAKYGQVDCIFAQLKRQENIDLGFVGNEADPNQIISPPWSYIAGGRIETLQALAAEVRKARWVVGSLAKADDGTGFLTFSTPDGMTAAQAESFNARIWKKELGDITFGTAPTKTGSRFGEDN